MGTFHKQIEIGALGSSQFVQLDALVDTGASFTVVPRDVLARLGVQATESDSFVLADGSQRQYDMAWVQVRIDSRVELSLCVFGESGSGALLGAFTLEAFRLGVDALNHRLIPTPAYLTKVMNN